MTSGSRTVGHSGPEKKNADVLNTTAIVAGQSASVAFLLNGMMQGTGATNCVGRRVNMDSLYFRWEGSFAATTAGASPLRVLVVYDKEPKGSAPAITDVVTTDAIHAIMNLDNSRRFEVICDDIVECVGTGGPQAWYHTRFINLKNRVIERFDTSNTGGISDIVTGSLFVIIWQSGNIITAAPTHAFHSRVRFTDV